MTFPAGAGGVRRAAAAILAPSTLLLGRLRYATKFAVVGLVLLLPLAFVARSYVLTQDGQVAFSAKERRGVAYMTPLVALIREHVSSSDLSPPDRGSRSPTDSVARVDAADRRHGAALGVRRDWAAAKRLLTDRDRDPRSDGRTHDSFRTALLALVVRVGDASNLTLDPDLDSYYLMDALQFRLPAMLDTSGRIVDGALAADGDSDAFALGARVGVLERDMAALGRGLRTTARSTRSAVLKRRAPAAERRLRNATAVLTTQLVDAVESRDTRRVRPDAAAAVQERIAELAALVAPQLDELLVIRIRGLEANARRVEVITLVSGLLAAYLFVGFYRSVGSPVRAMVAALQAVGDGDLSQTVVVESRDELHQIAEAINHTVARTREANDHLERQATHDPLTGLPNRTLVLDRLRQGLARVQRHEKHLALLFIDLDRFKLVNDLRGHDSGDAVLRAVAQRLCALSRLTDTVGRLSGDEFVILCEDVEDTASVLVLARRVTEALRTPIATPDCSEVSIGASVGIAFAEPGRLSEPGDMMRDADAAMYRAKDRGRGRVEIFDEALKASVASREALQEDLLRAIRSDELVLHYQPIVDAASDRFTGLEALVRWNHPRRGLLGPAEFIPLAEDTGNIVPLGAWVLRTACLELAKWLADDPELSGLTMSVNLSVSELADPGLVARVRGTLLDADLEPDALCLELTESAVMTDPAAARQTLLDLSSLGVKLAIDDFGNGYSSLSYLRNLPVQTIKIDRSFISALGGTREDEAIVGLVANLGEALGLDVVAEGVETLRQLEDVRRLGCSRIQGFYFGRPLPADEARAHLAGAVKPVSRRSVEPARSP